MLDKHITREFTDTLFKALKKYAKKYESDEKDMRVFFNLDTEGQTVYQIYQTVNGQMKFRETVSFKALIDVKIDILQKEKKMPPIINLVLLSLNDDLKMEPMSARMMLMSYEGKLRMCLFESNTYKKDVSVEEIIEILSKLVIE